jgi:hypothetical protein
MGQIGTEDAVEGRLTGARQDRYGRVSGGQVRPPELAENAKCF